MSQEVDGENDPAALFRVSMCFVAAIPSIAITTSADAKRRHASSQVIDANADVVGRRLVAIRTELNLASNWIGKFPRTFSIKEK
jgi:hypothetical protein